MRDVLRLIPCLFVCAAIAVPALARANNDPGLDPADSLVRYRYANDVFNRTDYYYTQGMRLEWRNPALRRSPLARYLLPSHLAGRRYHSLVVNHAGFTPTGTAQDDIRFGDRPFAAALYAGQRLVIYNAARRVRLTAQLDLGVIGPLAGGKSMQEEIHRGLDQRLPRGWNNQIHNDIVLNYGLELRATPLRATYADLQLHGKLRAGTLYTDIAAGLSGRSGLLANDGAVRAYLFATGDARAVGYNATLQGGLFNVTSPYTILPEDVTPVVFRGVAGVSLSWRRFGATISNTWITREFASGRPHQWLQATLTARF